MSYLKNGFLFSALAGAAAAGFAGCTGENAPEPPGTLESEMDGVRTTEVAIPEEMSGISKLPESEQAAALEQEICPVSEKPLGSMGKPIKVAVDGQEVFVCCEGCVDMVKESPDEYLAKLKKE